MRKLKFHTTSLIIILCIFCIGLTALLWWQVFTHSQTDRKETINRTIRHNNNLVFSLEQHTIRTLEEADAVLRLTRQEIERYGMHVPLNTLLMRGLSDLKLFEGLAVLDTTGKIVNTFPQQSNEKLLQLSDREHFLVHKKYPDTFYISTPIISKTINKPVLVLSRRINDRQGNFQGTIAIQILPSRFMSFYREASLNQLDILSLIAPDGITYARRTGDKESSGENIIKSPLFNHVAKNPVGSYYAKDAIAGIPTYFSYRKIHGYPIIATVGSSERDVLANYQLRKKREFAFGIAGSLLVLGLGTYVIITIRQRRKDIMNLIESESKYRSIFQGSQDAIFLLDAEGRIMELNESALHMFRLSEPPKHQVFTNIFKYGETFKDFEFANQPSGEVSFERLDQTGFIGEISWSKFLDANQMAQIILLIRDVTPRKKMEKQLELSQKKHQTELTKQIITAQEKERELIGKELHDNINQVLTTVKLYLETATKDSTLKDEMINRSIRHIMNCIQEIRSLSHSLSAPTLGTHSLLDSIKSLAENIQTGSSLNFSFATTGFRLPVSKDQSLALYRIAQEQFTNIIKHAKATEVKVELAQDSSNTILTISDNGVGFHSRKHNRGIGINNMTSRAKAFQGSLTIDSLPGEGCTLSITLPLEDPEAIELSWHPS